jgi:hypothetical protein
VECTTPRASGNLAILSPPLRCVSASSLTGTSSSGRSKAVVQRTSCRTGAMWKADAGIGTGQATADWYERTCSLPGSAAIRGPTRTIQQAPGQGGPRPGPHAQVYTFAEIVSSAGSHRPAQTRGRRAARSWPHGPDKTSTKGVIKPAAPILARAEHSAFLLYRF